MFGLSLGHIIILGIVVLLFGSRRLPELGSSLGKGMRGFKEAMEGKGVIEEFTQIKSDLNEDVHKRKTCSCSRA